MLCGSHHSFRLVWAHRNNVVGGGGGAGFENGNGNGISFQAIENVAFVLHSIFSPNSRRPALRMIKAAVMRQCAPYASMLIKFCFFFQLKA